MAGGVVVGTLSAPGGVGKTTIALLLSWFLRSEGRSVLAVDLDPSISLSLYIVRDEFELVEYEKKGRTLTHILEKAIEKGERVDVRDYVVSKRWPGAGDLPIDVVIPDINLSGKIDTLWYGRAYRELLRDLVDRLELRSLYDFVVVDTIPFYDKKYAILLLHAVDFCVVPLRPTLIDLYRTFRMLKELPEIAHMDGSEVYGKTLLVFNMHDRRSPTERKLIEGARRLFKEKLQPSPTVLENVVPKLIAFARLGTQEEREEDRTTVQSEFKGLYEELAGLLKAKA